MSRQPSLLEACADPRLFGWDPWPRQRELLEALNGPWQRHIWACGRRSGKTSCLAAAGLHSCLFRPDLDALVQPGEQRFAVVVANRKEQARLSLAAARRLVQRSALLSSLVERDTEDEIAFRLPTGARTVFAAFPCGQRGGRGWPISFLGLDELAHFLDSEGNSAAEPVWAALTPALAQFGALGRIVASSTPAGPLGKFAELYQRASSGEDASAIAFQFTSAQMNPSLSADWLAAQEADDPDLFAAEYEARFVGGTGALFDMDRVNVGSHVMLPPSSGRDWVLACDVAVQRDPFAAVVVGRSATDPQALLIGAVEAWRPTPSSSFEERADVETELFDRAVALGRQFGVTRVLADQHLSALVRDRFERAGFGVVIEPWTARSRYDAFRDLRAALYTGALELPQDAELTAELRQVRVKHAGAASTVVTPRTARGHCDRALALAAGVRWHVKVGVQGGEFRGRRAVSAGGDYARSERVVIGGFGRVQL